MLFGQRFVWVTDCYAIRFILSYDGNNPAISRLQMRLMCWDVDIVHRNNSYLVDADYWSHLGADVCFDPLFKSYLDFDGGLCQRFSAPVTLPMKPENMSYYRGPWITNKIDAPACPPAPACIPAPTCTPADPSAATRNADNSHCQSIFSAIIDNNCNGLCHLANVPVTFGDFDSVTPDSTHESLNHEIPAYAQRVLCFGWAVYSFGGGHFLSTISSRNLPFNVTLACDTYEFGRALFKEFSRCPNVFSSGNDLLHHIRSSGDSSQVHGYLIHSLRFKDVLKTQGDHVDLLAAPSVYHCSTPKPPQPPDFCRNHNPRPRRKMRQEFHPSDEKLWLVYFYLLQCFLPGPRRHYCWSL
jgi:hypothetical protein